MNWITQELTPGTFLIQDGHVTVGSIAKVDDKWLVEILWSGPTGDIQFQSPSMAVALGFIEGVEKAFAAIKATRA